jgi:hypothetical protein
LPSSTVAYRSFRSLRHMARRLVITTLTTIIGTRKPVA